MGTLRKAGSWYLCFWHKSFPMPRKLSIEVSPAIGKVSAEYIVPEKASCIMTLAHGAGAGMNHAWMVTMAESLAEVGIGTLRFNFPFTENSKGRPDSPAVAHETIEAAILHAHKSYPALPVLVSGKSFGGRMSSQYLSTHSYDFVKGIIFYGFPLHPSGKPSVERAEHLKEVKIPMLFLQGTKDTLATWDLIEPLCASLPNATLVKLEGADHSFKAGKQNTTEILTNATRDWIHKKLKLK
jgi:predicted alpha/beta-hydrolase family hydrolase